MLNSCAVFKVLQNTVYPLGCLCTQALAEPPVPIFISLFHPSFFFKSIYVYLDFIYVYAYDDLCSHSDFSLLIQTN